jgi:hypothetical protein
MRIKLALLMILVIALGLTSRRIVPFTQIQSLNYLGDALWAIMVYLTLWFMKPNLTQSKYMLPVVSIVISWAVEFQQLLMLPWLIQIRQTTIGHLALGNGFDPIDLLAYMFGVVIFDWARKAFGLFEKYNASNL